MEFMKALTPLAVVAGLSSTCAGAIQLHKRTGGPPQVVGFPVERRSIPNPIARDKVRRRGTTVQAGLDNEVSLTTCVESFASRNSFRKRCTLSAQP